MLFPVLKLRRILHKTHVVLNDRYRQLQALSAPLFDLLLSLCTSLGTWDSKDCFGSRQESVATVFYMVNCTESFQRQKNSFLTQFQQSFLHKHCRSPTVHLSPLSLSVVHI
jgi:hypothetical protein